MKYINLVRLILIFILVVTGMLIYVFLYEKSIRVPLERTYILLVQGLLSGIFLLSATCLFLIKTETGNENELTDLEQSSSENKSSNSFDSDQNKKFVFKPVRLKTNQELNPESVTDEETVSDMEIYLHNFYNKYKNFYGDIQKIPVQPEDWQKHEIKRQLIEMGLHALSFARVCKLKKLHRIDDEPNVRLIIEDLTISELEHSSYRNYTDDPYKTEKRYHILRKIFQEMNLEHLDAIVETVYISPEFLKKP